jgi:hypothetical protein
MNVNTEPSFGMVENPRSVRAATKASQLTDPRAADDPESSVEKVAEVDGLTLNTCRVGRAWSGVAESSSAG